MTQRAHDIQEYTARLMKQLILSIPLGTFSYIDFIEDDGFGHQDLAIHCEVQRSGERLQFDFRGSDLQTMGPVNAVKAITTSAVQYVLQCLAPGEMPSNAGVMRAIDVLTEPGTIVDASYPAAVAGGNVETSQRIVDVLLGAFAQIFPDQIPAASCGSMNNITIGGTDPRNQRPFAYYETIGGGAGGGPLRAGESGVHTHMTNTLNTPVEALEHAYPFRIDAYQLRTGSGGKGRHQVGMV